MEEQLFELMKKEENRLITYQLSTRWPHKYIDTSELARAGFFFSLNADLVCCAFCRGVIDQWKVGDNPMYKHIKTFLFCPFMMGVDVGNEPMEDSPSIEVIFPPIPENCYPLYTHCNSH